MGHSNCWIGRVVRHAEVHHGMAFHRRHVRQIVGPGRDRGSLRLEFTAMVTLAVGAGRSGPPTSAATRIEVHSMLTLAPRASQGRGATLRAGARPADFRPRNRLLPALARGTSWAGDAMSSIRAGTVVASFCALHASPAACARSRAAGGSPIRASGGVPPGPRPRRSRCCPSSAATAASAPTPRPRWPWARTSRSLCSSAASARSPSASAPRSTPASA